MFKALSRVFQDSFKNFSKVFQGRLKLLLGCSKVVMLLKVYCCMSLIVATRAEGGLVHFENSQVAQRKCNYFELHEFHHLSLLLIVFTILLLPFSLPS